MRSNKKDLLEQLTSVKALKDENQVNTFLCILESFEIETDDLKELLLLFSDQAVHKDPLKYLLNHLAVFDSRSLITALVMNIPQMKDDALEWLHILIYVFVLDEYDAQYLLSLSESISKETWLLIQRIIEDLSVNDPASGLLFHVRHDD